MKKGLLYPLFFGMTLTAYTAYVALNTFVLPSTYQKDATQMNLSQFDNIAVQTTTAENSAQVQTSSMTLPAAVQTDAAQAEQTNLPAETAILTDLIAEVTNLPSETIAVQTAAATNPQQASAATVPVGVPTTQPPVQVQQTTPPPVVTQPPKTEPPAPQTSQLENPDYQDANISIKMTEYRENHTNIYVAEVVLSSAQYLKSAFAKDSYGKNITDVTTKIASDHNAILAINGDFYGAQESGCVIRNGVDYRDSTKDEDVLCVYVDGSMRVVNGKENKAKDLVASGVWQAYCFGPGLVSDSKVTVSERDEVATAMASNPRTAIGMISPCHYLFVVSDGRTRESQGLSLYQLANFMQKLGATTAYNLDGGGSSSMVFQGELINKPTTSGFSIKERSVSDIVYIG